MDTLKHAIISSFIGYEEMVTYRGGLELIRKGPEDGVDATTALDRRLEKVARDYLARESGEPIFGEEEEGGDKENARWVLDKIDGTLMFRNNQPIFGSVVAHLDGDEADISSIVLPKMRELYVAVRGEGAYKVDLPKRLDFGEDPMEWVRSNGKRLETTKVTEPRDVVIVSDLAYEDRSAKLKHYVSKFADDVSYCPILGSSAYTTCQVANGSFGAYVIFDVDMNDVLAGALMIEEAGGRATDLEGNNVTRNTRDLIGTANRSIHHFLENSLGSD